MVVQFVDPMPITNAACCNDHHVQCERCAQAAVYATSHTDDPPLPPPETYWNQIRQTAQRAPRPSPREYAYTSVDNSGDLLLSPHAVPTPRRPDQSGDLPMPVMLGLIVHPGAGGESHYH